MINLELQIFYHGLKFVILSTRLIVLQEIELLFELLAKPISIHPKFAIVNYLGLSWNFPIKHHQKLFRVGIETLTHHNWLLIGNE